MMVNEEIKKMNLKRSLMKEIAKRKMIEIKKFKSSFNRR